MRVLWPIVAYHVAVALSEIELPLDGPPPPIEVLTFLEDAEIRIAKYLSGRPHGVMPSFVPCDGRAVYHGLERIRARGLAPGDDFCEWGAGFGIAACLAAKLGYHAFGIEIEETLVTEAQSLAEDAGLDVQYACGTFIPEGGDHYLDLMGEFEWLKPGGDCGYTLLDYEPDEFDLFFAYPWPGEEDVIEGIFEEYAARGALLLTDHGDEGLRLRRKT